MSSKSVPAGAPGVIVPSILTYTDDTCKVRTDVKLPEHYVGDQGQRFLNKETTEWKGFGNLNKETTEWKGQKFLHKETTPEEEAPHSAKICAELFDTMQLLQKRLDENPSIANAECLFAVTKVYHDALRQYLFK